MAKFYAWSDIYNGGESKEGRDGRKIIMSRNVTEAGSEVTQAKLGLNKEQWDGLIANGSVRSYPLPKDIRFGESPADAVIRKLTKGQGEVDPNMLMEMALSHAPEGGGADEADDVPVGA